ncbi:DUF805 domain-containing protein [Dokdonella soli]|uniref:DUF805 domain-containing protein n=1 Tax=Dokdonella soli TaxID=529810 RepID=A0ABP3TMX5_9GAMM
MNPFHLLATGGRFKRQTFFFFWAANTAQLVSVALLFPAMFDTGNTLVTMVALVYVLTTTWIFFASAAKRWHDTNRSAMYALIMFVPVVGVVVNLLLCLLLDGTSGPNRFGEAPV